MALPGVPVVPGVAPVEAAVGLQRVAGGEPGAAVAERADERTEVDVGLQVLVRGGLEQAK